MNTPNETTGHRPTSDQAANKSTVQIQFDCLHALEIAHELRVERERIWCLAHSIINDLMREPGEDSPSPYSWRISGVLEEIVGDSAQTGRLIKYLEQANEALTLLGAD